LESDIHEAENLLAEIKNRRTDARQNKQAIAKTAQDLTKQTEQYNQIIKSTPSKLSKVRAYSQPWIQLDKQAALYHEQSYSPQYSSNKPIEIPPTIADASGSCSEEAINPLVSELMQIVKNAKPQLTQADQFNHLKTQAQQCFTAAQQLSAKQAVAFEGTISGVVTGMCKNEETEYAVKGTFTITIFPNGDVTGTFAGDDEGAIKGKIDPKGNIHAGGGRADSYIWEGTIWQLKGKQGLAGKGTWHGINILDDNCGGAWHSN